MLPPVFIPEVKGPWQVPPRPISQLCSISTPSGKLRIGWSHSAHTQYLFGWYFPFFGSLIIFLAFFPLKSKVIKVTLLLSGQMIQF